MTVADFEAALEHTDEVEITTTGRVTGKPITTPVWFVRRGETLYLVPGGGRDSGWYKNVQKTPTVSLAAGGTEYSASAAPITEPSAFARVLGYFEAKYGKSNVHAYYPSPNVALELPLA